MSAWAGGACGTGNSSDLPAAVAARWSQDSARYQQELAKWLRDSVVVDSVARTVPTDSLARLYHLMVRAKRPELVLDHVTCERRRLRRLYSAAGALAAERVEDSVYARNRLRAARMIFRMPDHGLAGGTCTLGGPRGPDTVSGTPMRRRAAPAPMGTAATEGVESQLVDYRSPIAVLPARQEQV